MSGAEGSAVRGVMAWLETNNDPVSPKTRPNPCPYADSAAPVCQWPGCDCGNKVPEERAA